MMPLQMYANYGRPQSFAGLQSNAMPLNRAGNILAGGMMPIQPAMEGAGMSNMAPPQIPQMPQANPMRFQPQYGLLSALAGRVGR